MDVTRRGQPDRRLRTALLVALLLHGALVLGVSFDTGGQAPYRPQIDVTLARQPAAQTPEDASHFAQANQLGSGDRSEHTEVSARASTPRVNPGPPQPTLLPRGDQPSSQRRERSLATRAAAERRQATERDARELVDPAMQGIDPSADPLTRELAELEAALDEQSRAYSNLPRVRRLTSLSTQASIDAAYLHDWRQRVEAVGNRYYPEASVRYGIYGSLRLLVVIDYSGQLEDIRVLSSSGYALLDEAAIKIVRMAAPYAPFPPELRATADKLEIIRTWQFQENRLSSG
ncbi:energy transducer TonB [Parahaliea mediterranea]|uniref:Energy transducer TonB n=1 Tax=Parahaliea mediterranea TaxID=651086 RepID=A0A939DFL2_9GAMM|nr:energy transducer TonB [Parahaliea mediterranea]